MRKTVFSLLLITCLIQAQSRNAPAPPKARTEPVAASFKPTVAAPELHLEGDNHTTVLRQLYTYEQSGQYDREISQVTKPAHDWLQARTASATPNEKLAAVFDIDETSLSNVPYLLDCAFCSSSVQSKLYPADRLPAIIQVRDLYNLAKSKKRGCLLRDRAL